MYDSNLPPWGNAAAAVIAAHDFVGVHRFTMLIENGDRDVIAHSDRMPRRGKLPAWCLKMVYRLATMRNDGAYDFEIVITDDGRIRMVVKNPHQPYKVERVGEIDVKE